MEASVWQLVRKWVGWIWPVPMNSHPSHLPACCQQLIPLLLIYSASLQINFATDLQNSLLGFLIAFSQSCKGQTDSPLWAEGHCFRGYIFLLFASVMLGLLILLPCLWQSKCEQLNSLSVEERTSLKGLLTVNMSASRKWRKNILGTEPPLLSTDADKNISRISLFFFSTFFFFYFLKRQYLWKVSR